MGLWKSLTNVVKTFDPFTTDVAQGVDYYVQNFGDSMDKTFNIGQPKPAPLNPLANTPPSLITPAAVNTSSDLRLAQRKSLADQLSRKGRQSTLLSNNDSLGAVG